VAVAEAMKTVKFGARVKDMETVNNHAELMVPWVASLGAKVADIMRPEYGHFYGFEFSVPANAEMLAMSAVSYR
jgi:hypothetical protein